MHVHFCTHVYMLVLLRYHIVSDEDWCPLPHLKLPTFCASATAEVFISSLAEHECTDSLALAPAECPLARFLSVAVGMQHVLVFRGWDVARCMLAALPGAARLGAACGSSASIRSGWHSAFRFPSP